MAITIDLDGNVYNQVVDDYINGMKSKLLNGEEFVIDGVGVLKPVYRKVKNDYGNNFTVRVRMDYFKEFYDSIIESCKKDNSRFSNRKARSNNNVKRTDRTNIN